MVWNHVRIPAVTVSAAAYLVRCRYLFDVCWAVAAVQACVVVRFEQENTSSLASGRHYRRKWGGGSGGKTSRRGIVLLLVEGWTSGCWMMVLVGLSRVTIPHCPILYEKDTVVSTSVSMCTVRGNGLRSLSPPFLLVPIPFAIDE